MGPGGLENFEDRISASSFRMRIPYAFHDIIREAVPGTRLIILFSDTDLNRCFRHPLPAGFRGLAFTLADYRSLVFRNSSVLFHARSDASRLYSTGRFSSTNQCFVPG
jgi:hypothetical protein